MNTNHKTVDALDEMLRLAVLERSVTLSSEDQWIEQMAERIFSTSPEVSPTDQKWQELFERLLEGLNELETFGDLLSSALQRQNLDLPKLSEAIELSHETLEQLSQDNLFPDHVPVLLMKRLIEFLGLSFGKAKTTLQKTAALIIENQSAKNMSSLTPAFARRRAIDKISKEHPVAIAAGDFLDQYSADASLEIYLRRLEALFESKNITKQIV
jgi:hypothetical protein